MTVYVSIGNSDDKLPQAEWARYCADVERAINVYADQRHGVWYSAPDSAWQNACWCFDILAGKPSDRLQDRLADLAREYRQDSIAWAIADTHFIEPTSEGTP